MTKEELILAYDNDLIRDITVEAGQINAFLEGIPIEDLDNLLDVIQGEVSGSKEAKYCIIKIVPDTDEADEEEKAA